MNSGLKKRFPSDRRTVRENLARKRGSAPSLQESSRQQAQIVCVTPKATGIDVVFME